MPYQPNHVFLGEVRFVSSFDLVCQVFSPPSAEAEAASRIAKKWLKCSQHRPNSPVKLHQPGLVKTLQP